jgi:hypothetical protein
MKSRAAGDPIGKQNKANKIGTIDYDNPNSAWKLVALYYKSWRDRALYYKLISLVSKDANQATKVLRTENYYFYLNCKAVQAKWSEKFSRSGNHSMLRFLRDTLNVYPKLQAMNSAISNDQLECVKYIKEHGVEITPSMVERAKQYQSEKCIEYFASIDDIGHNDSLQ